MPWIACLAVPLFPLAARLRSEPDLVEQAVVVVEGNGNAARVVAGTRRCRRAGIRPGQTLPQARALVPQLVVRPRDPDCEASATAALLEAAHQLSPRLEDAGEGVVYADAEGLERHLRSIRRGRAAAGIPSAAAGEDEADDGEAGDGTEPASWQRILGHALVQSAEAAGLPVRVGVACSKLAARVAADQAGSPTVVAAGGEAAFLAPLPLHRLAPPAKLAATLESWGVRTVGDLAALPEDEVASRLGAAGEALHATARGEDPHPLAPVSPPPSFREGMALEWPIVNLEPFLFVGRAALERLTARLERHGLACARLDLALRLEPDGVHERSVVLPAPTRDVKTLLTLLRLDLEAHPPGAPVAGFTIDAHPDRPREAQLSLFGPEALSPDRLATTLARLFALLGPNRVGSPRPVDGHRPERFDLAPYEPPPPPVTRNGNDHGEGEGEGGPRRPRGGHGLLSVRALRPPVALEVLVDEAANGGAPAPAAAPRSLAALAHEAEARRPRIQGRVRVASGPWGLEEAWWSDEPVDREYWDVELASGGLYRIYRDLGTDDWFADGIYD